MAINLQTPRTPKVLLVEDDPEDVIIMGGIFKECSGRPITLEVAGSLTAAITKSATEEYDLVLLDLGLPDCSGAETLHQAREALPGTPIIVVTGMGDPDVKRECLDRGAKGFMEKSAVGSSEADVVSTVLRLCPGSAADMQEKHDGTILLVEDDPSARATIQRLLRRLGYSVLASATPDGALRLASEHVDEIAMLMTDVVLPGMTGCELASKFERLYPKKAFLLMSGYSVDAKDVGGLLMDPQHVLLKPFTRIELCQRLRQILA